MPICMVYNLHVNVYARQLLVTEKCFCSTPVPFCSCIQTHLISQDATSSTGCCLLLLRLPCTLLPLFAMWCNFALNKFQTSLQASRTAALLQPLVFDAKLWYGVLLVQGMLNGKMSTNAKEEERKMAPRSSYRRCIVCLLVFDVV